jgi:hypothetical protein
MSHKPTKDYVPSINEKEYKKPQETATASTSSVPQPDHESPSPVFHVFDMISASVAMKITRLETNSPGSSFFPLANQQVLEIREALLRARVHYSSPAVINALSSANHIDIIKSIVNFKSPGKQSLTDLFPTLFDELSNLSHTLRK